MKQEAMNVLLTRRSVRQYQTRQVSEQEMDQVLQAGLYAPCLLYTSNPIVSALHSAVKSGGPGRYAPAAEEKGG